ncbi:DUF6146 family protein [Rasiella sp. SM2506]|uniref:DUF6146 family protein n=1 Tax=Rasiella sp. SM2506 TaxID=3423914 RepID=UPI003D7C1015
MKKVALVVLFLATLIGCTVSQTSTMGSETNGDKYEEKPVRIANDSLEYEIIITDIGFPRFLNTQPPEDYYDINYLERRNNFFVAEYNRRVLDNRYTRDLYPQRIDYDFSLHYGKEVNYLLFQYFRYFSREYNQNFPGLRN